VGTPSEWFSEVGESKVGSMDKVKGFCVSFLEKWVEGCVAFIGGNLERFKGITFYFFFFFFLESFFVYYEVSIGIGVDN
jgi:hypothetical protein